MASITVDVDIDLDDLEIDEILDAVEYHWNRTRKQKDTREVITDFFKDLLDEDLPPTKKLSIIDEAKVAFLLENIESINIYDLENLVK